MRLLVVNSNTSDNITELISQEARASARPETEVEAITAPLGPRSVESRGELAVAAYGTLVALSSYPMAAPMPRPRPGWMRRQKRR